MEIQPRLNCRTINILLLKLHTQHQGYKVKLHKTLAGSIHTTMSIGSFLISLLPYSGPCTSLPAPFNSIV
jgi:hypothetical protein